MVDKEHFDLWCRDDNPCATDNGKVGVGEIEKLDIEQRRLEGISDGLQNCFDLGNQVAYQLCQWISLVIGKGNNIRSLRMSEVCSPLL